MAFPEKFNLSWNDFQVCASSTFRDLLNDQDFADVTLVSDNYKQIKAHKVVLGACSPIFKKILMGNPHQHPLIFLSGVGAGDLQAILNFMYLGQTEVVQQDLEDFMKIASKFEIKGLSEYNNSTRDEEESEVIDPDKEIAIPDNTQIIPNIKAEASEVEYVSSNEYNDASEITSYYDSAHRNAPTEVETYKIYEERNTNKTYDNNIHVNEIEGVFHYHCEHCDYKSNQKHNVVAHIKAKHEGKKFYCDLCDFQASFKTNVVRHKRKMHGAPLSRPQQGVTVPTHYGAQGHTPHPTFGIRGGGVAGINYEANINSQH